MIGKKLRSFLPRTRKSNPLSKLLRPLLEKQKLKSLFGIQIAGIAIVLSVVTYPTQAFEYVETPEVYIDGAKVEETTETTFQFPVRDSLGVSQGYSRYHPGMDIRGRVGTAIYPVAEGVVVSVQRMRYGYGNHVIIEHQKGFRSLYAHMNNMYVVPGQVLTKESPIGEIGMTGWTTGPHLHLEIMQEGLYLSPGSLIL